MCNMAVEAGAKVGVIEPDASTEAYVKLTARREYAVCRSDPDAVYESEMEWDVGSLEPQVACPHSPQNVVPVSELSDVKIDQVVIGSCTNGRMADMRLAGRILKGRKAAPHVRLLVIPATPTVSRQMVSEGLMEVFLDAEAVVSTPTCGPCLGGHMGVLGPGERAVATTNRNFVGRMGDPQSEVYLSSPAVAAASAVAGRIAHPDAI